MRVTSLAEQGYVILSAVFSPSQLQEVGLEIRRLHRDYKVLKAQFPDLHWMGEWSLRSPHVASKTIEMFLFSSEMRKEARKWIGEDVDLYWCTTADKPVLKGKNFPWHQDAGYGKGPMDYLIFWIALSDVNESNGCLWVLPESHDKGILEHEYRKSNEQDYAGVFVKGEVPNERDKVAVPVKAGDVVVMNSKLLHATFKNASTHPRQALVVALMKPQTQTTNEFLGMEETITPFLRAGRWVSSEFRFSP